MSNTSVIKTFARSGSIRKEVSQIRSVMIEKEVGDYGKREQ